MPPKQHYKAQERNPISKEDGLIGARMRQARITSGHTQQAIAQIFGVSSQQIAKFEFGINRITAKNLFKFSLLCDKPIEWFLQDISNPGPLSEHTDSQDIFLRNAISYLRQIEQPDLQQKILKCLQVLAE